MYYEHPIAGQVVFMFLLTNKFIAALAIWFLAKYALVSKDRTYSRYGVRFSVLVVHKQVTLKPRTNL